MAPQRAKLYNPAVIVLPLLLASFCAAAAPAAPDAKTAELAFLRGQLAEKRGAYAEALEAYEDALKADPESGYINRQAAELALEANDADKALRFAEAAATAQPKDAGTLVLLGRVQWALGRSEEAQESFEQALKLDPKSAESIYALASLLVEKQPEKAREMLTRFLEQNPEHAAEARFQLAKIELQLGHVKAAQKQLKESIALDPDENSAPVRYALAQSYEAEHSTDAALTVYKDLLKLEPQNPQLLDHIAEMYFLKDDWEDMRQALVKAKEAQPDDATANHWLALDAEKRGDWVKAIEYIKASEALKDDPTLWLRLSYYLTQAGHLDEAVATLEEAHKKWPQNDQVDYFLALGYDDIKKPELSIPLLREVLRLKPESRDARYQLGVVLEKTGRMAEAEPEFRRLLEEKPDDASVLNYLGYSLADRGLKLEEAEKLIAKAVALEPKNGAYLDSLGWVHYKLGRYDEAVKELEQAARLIGDDDEVWDHLGDAALKAGKRDAAWLYFKRSDSLVASGKPLREKAAQVEKEMTPEELGEAYLDYLKLVQGGIRKLTGVCRLQGEILKHPFEYKCLFTYKGDEDMVAVDVLGPMMLPAFRMKVQADRFEMDRLELPGVDPKAVQAGAAESLILIREYLTNSLWTLRPVTFKKSWGSKHIETPDWKLFLDKAAVRVEKIVPKEEAGYALSLSDFGRVDARQIPRTLTVDGKGFSLSIRFDNVKAVFDGQK